MNEYEGVNRSLDEIGANFHPKGLATALSSDEFVAPDDPNDGLNSCGREELSVPDNAELFPQDITVWELSTWWNKQLDFGTHWDACVAGDISDQEEDPEVQLGHIAHSSLATYKEDQPQSDDSDVIYIPRKKAPVLASESDDSDPNTSSETPSSTPTLGPTSQSRSRSRSSYLSVATTSTAVSSGNVHSTRSGSRSRSRSQSGSLQLSVATSATTLYTRDVPHAIAEVSEDEGGTIYIPKRRGKADVRYDSNLLACIIISSLTWLYSGSALVSKSRRPAASRSKVEARSVSMPNPRTAKKKSLQ